MSPINLPRYNKFEDRKTEINQIYNLRPQTTEERLNEEEPISAELVEVNSYGVVYISYFPPEVSVPGNWERIFKQEVRQTLETTE